MSAQPASLDHPSPWGGPRRLWSLWDMLRVYATVYITLGAKIRDLEMTFMLSENAPQIPDLDEGRPEQIKDLLGLMEALCGQIGLGVSVELLEKAKSDPPQSRREVVVLVRAIYAEMKARLFLYVPEHVAQYHEMDAILSEPAKGAFPTAHQELREAGNCLALGLHTASVFHSMRAAEIGVRCLGKELGVSFPGHPIELAEWHNILEQAEAKIGAMKNLPKSAGKDADLGFYSQAAVQLRYFKDGWRVRVAHARASYNEAQATEVIGHVRSFFESVSTRLKEQP